MKSRRFIIGFSLLLALAACHQKVKAPVPIPEFVEGVKGLSYELSAIDSLMWQRPDSALMCVISYFDTCGDAARHVSTDETFNNHYAHLLLSELLYKNDYAQTNRADLLRAVAYFDSLLVVTDERGVSADNATLAFLAARAHYINGVGYYEQDSAVEACKEYLTALEIMENHFKEKELVGKKAQFMALTYTHLYSLFSDFYLHEQAVFFGKQALEYFQKYNATPWHVAWILNEIGSHYDVMIQLDTADYYYRKSMVAILDSSSLMYRDIATRMAYFSYKTRKEVGSSLNRLYHLIALSESEKEFYSRCLTIGEIYYHEKQFDSAWVYLNKVFYSPQSIGAKKQSAEWLVEIGKEQNKENEIVDYAEFLIPFATQDENTGIVKSQLTEFCNKYNQQELEREHNIKAKRQSRVSIAVIAGLLVVTLGFVFLYLKNKMKKQHLEAQINEEKYAYEMKQKALSGRLKRSNSALKELRKTRPLLQSVSEAQSLEGIPDSYAEEPICRLIMERVDKGQFKTKVDYVLYKDYALDKQQLSALRMAADRHFGQFTTRLKKAYPALTNSDLDYCCLYLLGLTDADIAALMQRAYNTVIERNGKLRKIFGSDNSLFSTLSAMTSQSSFV